MFPFLRRICVLWKLSGIKGLQTHANARASRRQSPNGRATSMSAVLNPQLERCCDKALPLPARKHDGNPKCPSPSRAREHSGVPDRGSSRASTAAVTNRWALTPEAPPCSGSVGSEELLFIPCLSSCARSNECSNDTALTGVPEYLRLNPGAENLWTPLGLWNWSRWDEERACEHMNTMSVFSGGEKTARG